MPDPAPATAPVRASSPDRTGATTLRILIVADNASARLGGEAILPLKYFTLLARQGHDVRLITHARNRASLTDLPPALAERVTYSPDTAAHRLLWRIGARLPGALRDHLIGNVMGLITGWTQARMARAIVRQGLVDIVHQPIPVSPTAPSMMFALGAPVVIGPMNGGMRYPPGYEDFEGRAARFFTAFARPLAGLVNRLIPGKRRAALLLVANPRSRAALPVRAVPVVELCENAVDFALWPDAGPRPMRDGPAQEGPFRLVFMGRLVDWKALDLTLRALALARQRWPDGAVTLDVFGEGPERGALETLVSTLGLDDVVRFHGYLPQEACARHLKTADALILCSLRECGGAVVLEAQAMGLAVIASDWGGPKDLLDDASGLLLPPSPRETFVERQAQAIVTLASDRARTRAMGAAGAARVRAEFDWNQKVETMVGLYRDVLARTARRR